MAHAGRIGEQVAALLGELMPMLGELGRREAFRSEGATSLAAWITERFGVSGTTARQWQCVAESLWDLPHLANGLREGSVSLDKVRAAVALATPETDAEILATAQTCSVRQLADMAKHRNMPTDQDAAEQLEARYVRFNDDRRTITAQLPSEQYALARGAIEAVAREIPSDGFTRWDHRTADGFMQILLSLNGVLESAAPANLESGNGTTESVRGQRAGSFVVVAHTDLSYLQGSEGSAEIERLGLISRETIRRISCDADVILALDDDVGHTMFEGRRHRFPTPTQRREVMRRDRHCRFPGCSNVTFTNVHHVVHWTPAGPTDLPNLVLLCDHHHDRVHASGWRVSGDANEELTFVGPSGRPMTSRPSPLWTKQRNVPTP